MNRPTSKLSARTDMLVSRYPELVQAAFDKVWAQLSKEAPK